MERESFVFYRSFYESLAELDAESFKKAITRICEYALNGKDVPEKGVAEIVFKLVKPQIDANNKRYMNGLKGGNPKRNQTVTKPKPNTNQNVTKTEPNTNQNVTKTEPNTNQNVTKTEPNTNQNVTKTEPNVNVNDNVNENVNVNDNVFDFGKPNLYIDARCNNENTNN